MNASSHPRTDDATKAPRPAPRRSARRRRSHGVSRRLGGFSAPAGLLALCLAMAGAFVWGLSGAMAQVRAGVDGPLSLTLAQDAALFCFPVLTPLVLIAVKRLHWRLMRPWLKTVAKAVLAVWAVAAALMAYALL